MYIDFHCHSKLTKRAHFDPVWFRRTVRYAGRSGLTAIVLVEHFNTQDYCGIYRTLDGLYAYKKDYYDVDGFRVFTGIEVDIYEKGHIILLGNKANICLFREHFPDTIEKCHYPTFQKLLDLADDHSLLKIGAHPFRENTSLTHLDKSLLQRLDFVEMNAKDIRHQKKMYEFAQELERPIVGGSDAHHPIQVGTVLNHLFDECETVADIKNAVQNHRYEIILSPWAKEKNHLAKVIKKIIKKVKNI